jgi:phage terminase Nu1 subunit (DNA packaging protein)
MAASLTDVAVAIGVDVRTIHNWKSKGMPGVGPYDLDAIDQWRKNRGQGGRPDEDAASARRAEAQAQLMEAKLAEKQGKLVPIEDVRRLFVRHITEAGTILDQLSDQVAALMPAERPTAAEWPAIRAQVRTSAKRIIDAGRQALADALIDKKVAAKPEEQAACSS